MYVWSSKLHYKIVKPMVRTGWDETCWCHCQLCMAIVIYLSLLSHWVWRRIAYAWVLCTYYICIQVYSFHGGYPIKLLNCLAPRGSATLNFHRRDSGIFRFLAWFQDSWTDSFDSYLPNKGSCITWFIIYGKVLNIQE